MKAFPSNGFFEKTSGGEQPQKLNPVMGMDLRDYFAAQALMATIETSHSFFEIGDTLEEDVATVAKMAYLYADQMMKAREL